MLARIMMFQGAMMERPEMEIFGKVGDELVRLTAEELGELNGYVEIDVLPHRDGFTILNWEEATG